MQGIPLTETLHPCHRRRSLMNNTIHLGETHLISPEAGNRVTLDRLGLVRPYVLSVGTIEVRKNHALAVRAWRELLDRHGKGVPDLVLCGRWGWRTDDLRSGLDASDYLDGHVKVLSDLSDEDLAAVYRGARFTVFPSLYEGWGLPVVESHAHGKVCVASDSSSIPEAAGGLALLFENDNRPSLIDTVERILFDDTELARLEERLQLEFKPVPWSRGWKDVEEAIDDALIAKATTGSRDTFVA